MPSSNVVPIGRIGDGDAGDEDHDHGHGNDPLGWLRESIPGQNIFQHDMSIANSDQTILQQHSSMSRQIFPRFQILTDNDLVLLVFSR